MRSDKIFLLAPFPQLARAVSSRGALKARSREITAWCSTVTVRATPSSARFGWRGEYVHANSGPSVQTILTSDRCNS
jgi:hypothetical protein